MPPGVSFGPYPTDPTDHVVADPSAGPTGGRPGVPVRSPGVRPGTPVPGGLLRRAVLCCGAVAPLAGVLAACSGSGGGGAQDPPAEDAGLRRRTARDSSALLARYDATVRVHPQLEAALRPFREVVAAHLAALGEADAAAGSAGGAGPEVPAEPSAALGALVEAERDTAGRRLTALADAPPQQARLLASLAAAGSAQAYLLGRLREA